jgi:hypothetical protein
MCVCACGGARVPRVDVGDVVGFGFVDVLHHEAEAVSHHIEGLLALLLLDQPQPLQIAVAPQSRIAVSIQPKK